MIELELAPHYETLASTAADDYEKVSTALRSAPLYHQWRTYMAKDAHIVVNSYNTGTGKTKAALLRLLDLYEAYRKDKYANANVLFIAPTNELLRQHEQDIKEFIDNNHLEYLVLRLDAATIKELGQQHLDEKFIRQGDRLHQTRSSDEFIQRLGRAARVLGKEVSNIPSDVYAVVPDELLTELLEHIEPGKPLERSTLNVLINSILPQKSALYAYIQSGAIAEAFLPLYHINKASSSDEKQQTERLYQAVAQIYDTKKVRSFTSLNLNIQKYLKIKFMLSKLLHDAHEKHFTFGPESVILRTMDEQPDLPLDALNTIDAVKAQEIADTLRKDSRGRDKAKAKRTEEIEEYYTTDARFNFRDNFQPPLALAHDPKGLLATSAYTVYSALHILLYFRFESPRH